MYQLNSLDPSDAGHSSPHNILFTAVCAATIQSTQRIIDLTVNIMQLGRQTIVRDVFS